MTMSGTVSSVTIQTAPRDTEQLSQIGRFQLRRLAEQLGMLADDTARQAFMGGSNTLMAEALVVKLKEYDKGNNGTAAAPARAPVTTPATTNAGTVAPAAQTPAATAPKRQPRTEDSAPADDTEAALRVIGALTDLTHQVDGLTKQIGETNRLAGETGVGSAKASERIDGLTKEISQLNPYLKNLHEAVQGMATMQLVGLTLNLMLAEQVLQAPREDILQTAFADVKSIATLIATLNQGK
jgi:hypothetical protein